MMSKGSPHGSERAPRAASPLFGGPSSPLPAPTPTPTPTPARELDLMGEFIGSHLTIVTAPGWQTLPWEGVVVDETRNTFRVVPCSGGRERVLSKTGLEGVLSWEGKAIRFKGDELRHRPEDRIKRLAPKGRSRRP